MKTLSRVQRGLESLYRVDTGVDRRKTARELQAALGVPHRLGQGAQAAVAGADMGQDLAQRGGFAHRLGGVQGKRGVAQGLAGRFEIEGGGHGERSEYVALIVKTRARLDIPSPGVSP